MSMLFDIVIYAISLMYLIVILLFAYGWIKLNIPSTTEATEAIPVSIVIACRNEEENIAQLLDSLLNQDYPENKTEIIIVDDHSSDNFYNLA